MGDKELMDELYRRFHSASANAFSDRIAHLPIDDLPFKDTEGTPFGEVKHLIRGDDKSGAAFDIYRLGWFGGRVWELVVVDGAYLPHMHRKINSEFFIVAGRGQSFARRQMDCLPGEEWGRGRHGGGSRFHHRSRIRPDRVPFGTKRSNQKNLD